MLISGMVYMYLYCNIVLMTYTVMPLPYDAVAVALNSRGFFDLYKYLMVLCIVQLICSRQGNQGHGEMKRTDLMKEDE